MDNIGLVFVDGPPGTLHPLVRYPALPLLRPRLAANATVVLDDFIRDQEQEIANRWSEEFPELKMTEHQFEKGAAVLRLLANRQTETPQSSR
ncbi:MAG: hypothetical protein DWP92_06910 [Armatimonadetes bacterium]|nr:MAG: hypothetical protein DWP92_06910 [Armatimonadota bacterium]